MHKAPRWLLLSSVLWVPLLVGLVLFPFTRHPSTHPTTGVYYSALSSGWAGEKLFGLSPVTWVVNSSYWSEAGLVSYQTPSADIDFGTGYAAQQIVRLPGNRSDHYGYRGALFIFGSGWAELWDTPWGTPFALLHLSSLAVAGPASRQSVAPVKSGQAPAESQVEGDARIVAQLTGLYAHRAPMASYGVGGQVVGRSGWPTSSAYSNGSCWDYESCKSDAHLCLVVTDGSARFFDTVLVRRVPTPTPRRPLFGAVQSRVWGQYRKEHRLSPIPHTGWFAWHWRKANFRRAGGIVRPEQWLPRHRVMKERLQGFYAYWWPSKHWPIRWVKHAWLR